MISTAPAATARRALGLALAVAWLVAAPAQAVNDRGTFHEEDDRMLDCGAGLVLDVHNVIDGRYLGVQRGKDRLWYYAEQWNHIVTYTNPATGLALTSENVGLATKDQTITDNGDGTVTIRVLSPAPVRVHAPDGHMVSHFSGLAIYRFLYDDAGTPQDPNDDEFLEFLGVDALHGHNDDRGICDLATEYLV